MVQRKLLWIMHVGERARERERKKRIVRGSCQRKRLPEKRNEVNNKLNVRENAKYEVTLHHGFAIFSLILIRK